MPRTNFFAKAIAIIAFVFSLIGCEKMGDESTSSMTWVTGSYSVKVDTVYTYINQTDTVIVKITETINVPVGLNGWVAAKKSYPCGPQMAVCPWFFIDKNNKHTATSFAKVENPFSAEGGEQQVEELPSLADKEPIWNEDKNVSYKFKYNDTEVFSSYKINYLAEEVEFYCAEADSSVYRMLPEEISVSSDAIYQKNDTTLVQRVNFYLDGSWQCSAEYNFLTNSPAPTPVYTLEVAHNEARVDNNKVIDTHIANLLKDGEKVESQEYDALWSINYSKLAIPREVAETLQKSTVSLKNGSCELGSSEFIVSLSLTDVESVCMQENGTTYCHPAFPIDQAVVALDCCNLSATNIVIGSINDDVLPAEIVVVGHEEIRVPFTINVTDKPEVVRDTTYSQAVPVSATQAKVIRNITANGKQESSKDILVPYAVKFECGEKEMISNMATLDYGKAVAANTGNNTVAMNIHEFSATVEVPSTLTFKDEGKQISVDFIYKNLAIESNGAITRTDNSDDKFELINNTAYFKVVIDGFSVATDTKEIEQKKEISYRWEWDENVKFSPDMKQVTRRGYLVKNNVRTGFYKDISVNLEYTFTPGAALEFNSNETPSIKDANAVLVGNEAFIPHILGSTEFNANFTYGGTSRVTFSYSDEYVSDEVTVDLNITYSVKATGTIEQNGNSYSTPAALYANGVEVKNEKFVFEVKPIQATYPGYRVYNAGQWAITRIYNQNATTSLVVLVGTLEHIQSGDIYAIHQVLEGSAGNLPENFQKISTPSFGEPYSMYYNVAASAWNYGSIVGAKKGTTNANWMYFNWSRTDNQIVSVNTATDLLDDIVLYQLGSEDNLSSEAGNISLAYNGTTITVVSDK